MKFIDMFAGIGGFRSGLEKAGHKCVGYIEWDKFARQSYQAMYDTQGEFNDDDIQRTKGIKLPEADLWTFGSPCTNISIAGNRTGIKGEQSRMFFEVIRLLKERAENQKTLPAQGGNLQPQIVVKACLTPDRPHKRQNGRHFKGTNEPAFTLTVADRNGVLLDDGNTVAIRKLTPRECWRLQGFTDVQFDKAKRAGVSNSQLYKQAGNAVTIPVVEAIGKKLAENETKNDM